MTLIRKIELPYSELVKLGSYLLSPYDPEFEKMHKLKDEQGFSDFEILVVIDEISRYTGDPYRSVWAVEAAMKRYDRGDYFNSVSDRWPVAWALGLRDNARFRFVHTLGRSI